MIALAPTIVFLTTLRGFASQDCGKDFFSYRFCSILALFAPRKVTVAAAAAVLI